MSQQRLSYYRTYSSSVFYRELYAIGVDTIIPRFDVLYSKYRKISVNSEFNISYTCSACNRRKGRELLSLSDASHLSNDKETMEWVYRNIIAPNLCNTLYYRNISISDLLR